MKLSILRKTATIGAIALANATVAIGRAIPQDGQVIWETRVGLAYFSSYMLQIRMTRQHDFQVGMVRSYSREMESDFIGSIVRHPSLSDAVTEAVLWFLDVEHSAKERENFSRQFRIEISSGQQILEF